MEQNAVEYSQIFSRYSQLAGHQDEVPTRVETESSFWVENPLLHASFGNKGL
jgi:hypothetical protein